MENQKKAMLSQPMAGKTNDEIVATREHAVQALEAKGYQIVNTLFTDEWYSKEAMEKIESSNGDIVDRIKDVSMRHDLEAFAVYDEDDNEVW